GSRARDQTQLSGHGSCRGHYGSARAPVPVATRKISRSTRKVSRLRPAARPESADLARHGRCSRSRVPMDRRAVLIAASVVAWAPAARAQPGAPAPLSLREALAYARAHQPSIAAARARVEVALSAAEVPRAALAPRVTGSAELLIGTS